MTEPTIRFGYSDSIHLLPLLYPLQAGWVYPRGLRLELLPLPPQELNDAAAAGALDGALLDPLAFARLRQQFEPLPGIGLVSEGANSAAVLRSAERADSLDGAVIAGTPGIGEALMKVLMQPYFGIDARLLAPGDAADAPGRVLAGDEAVTASAPWLRYRAQFDQADDERTNGKKAVRQPVPAPDTASDGYSSDLGAGWWVLTGTPMVWAIAAVRQEMLEQERVVVELVQAFRESRRAAQEQLASVVSAADKRLAVGEPAIRAVFAAQRVEIGARDHGGLALFYEHTRRLGLTGR